MKSSYYFQHDYNASNDHKILYLRQQLGIEGYGIYWYVIEQLAQSNGVLPVKIIPVLSTQIQTTIDKVKSVIFNYDLFVFDSENFFSARLLKQIEFRKDLSKSGKLGAQKRWEKKLLDQTDSPPISIPKGTPNAKERKGKEIYTPVISLLNEKTGKAFKESSKKTQSLIDARLNESFTLEDFFSVIETMVARWKGTDMDQYLRPETLFGPKFEGYLNSKPAAVTARQVLSKSDVHNLFESDGR